MIHYQGSRVPNVSMLNCVERLAHSIPIAMLALRPRLIVADIQRKHGVSKSLASQAVGTARAWHGMRQRLGDSGGGDER